MMSALAERWYEEQQPDSDRERTSALSALERCGTEAGRYQGDGTRWNVLAEQLVSFPSRSQQIWLGDGGHTAAHEETAEPSSSSRHYADAWLEQELERLRDRSRRVLTDLGDASTGRRAHETTPPSSPKPSARRTPASRALATPAPAGVAKSGQRGLRRILPGAATLAVLAASWLGIGTLAESSHHVRVHELPGSVTVAGGFVYVVQPGDTIWSIASRAEPGADPRPLVDRLQAELQGRELQPGARLFIPT